MSGAMPRAAVKRRRFSPFWLIPIVAGFISLYLAVQYVADRGPLVTITFRTANGITAQQTEVRHKAVTLGLVEDVKLSRDLANVIVQVRMNRQGAALMTDHAHFWVVRPRLTPGNISGLETLVSGAYIEVDPGDKGGAAADHFVGYEEPPGVRSDEPGRTYVLNAARLGSVGPGTPVFYRDVNVGEVLGFDLGDGMGPVKIRLFVRSPYDRFVHDTTHFWNASGVSVGVGAQGLHLELQSLQAVLSGGVAFETPRFLADGPPSAADHVFRLYEDEAEANAAGFAQNVPFVTYFESSVAGLGRGSSVEVFGLQVGTVTDVRLELTADKRHLRARVAFTLQPERVFTEEEVRASGDPHEIARRLVGAGLRAVLASSNFLTGQKVISLQYVPGAQAAGIGADGDAIVLPSEGGGLDNLTNAVSDITTRLRKIPFDEIGADLAGVMHGLNRTVNGPDLQHALRDLSAALGDARALVANANRNVSPALARLPRISADLQQAVTRANAALGEGGFGANSDVQRSLGRVLDQVQEAARSIRLLADFLERHPEALITGRSRK